MKYRFVLALVFLHTSIFCSPSRQSEPVLLISAPRNGANWTLACLQFLTGRYVSHIQSYPKLCKDSFTHEYNRLGLKLDRRKPYLFRTHDLPTKLRSEIKTYQAVRTIKKIMILRNYREVALLYCKFNPSCRFNFAELYKIAFPGAALDSYITLLQQFDKLPDSNKMLCYYEDLIQRPKHTLSTILNFIHEPSTRLNEFIENIDSYKNQCADSYYKQMGNIDGPISRDFSVNYYSDNASPEIIEDIDKIVKLLAGEHIWNKYLKHYSTNPK